MVCSRLRKNGHVQYLAGEIRACPLLHRRLCLSQNMQQVAIEERTIPKTTSGKIQRRKTRAMLHAGALEVVQELRFDPVETPLPAVRGPAPLSDREESSPTAPTAVPAAERALHLASSSKLSPQTADGNTSMVRF